MQIASVTTNDNQCRRWRREGSCRFGSKCVFSNDHTTQTKGIEAPVTISKKKASPSTSKIKEPMYPPGSRQAKIYQNLDEESRKIVAAAYDYEPEEGEEEQIRSFFKREYGYEVDEMNQYLDSDSDD